MKELRKVTLILAYGPRGELGNHGALPWPHHKEDMRRFADITIGGSLIMGRKTYDSLGKPLNWRQNIVLSRKAETLPGNVSLAKDMPSAINMAGNIPIFVIGGAAIYALAMPYAERILLTEMKGDFEADVFFKIPFIHQWTEVSREPWRGEGGDCDFVEYRMI